MDVDLDHWLPDMERLESFPTLPTEVPDDFLQPSTSGIQRPKKSPAVPASSRHVVNAVSSGSSDIYSSSEEDVKVKHRRRREQSRTERSRSRSRSRYSRKQSRSPSRKYRRSVSPGGAWIYVSSRESKVLRSPDHQSSERSPRRPPSKHGLDPRDLARRKDLSIRHKSSRPPVHLARRGETRFLPAQLGRKNQGKVYVPEGRRPGPCKVETAVDILSQGVSDDRASSAPVCFSPAKASMMEEMSRDLINVSSWLDWWASTLVGVLASYDPDQQSLMRDLITSGGKTLKFLTYQSLALTANWVLRKRDTVLTKVSRKVPDREARAIRSLPLWGESLFPMKELEALMEKVSKRKEANVTKPAASRRPPYKRSVSDSAATPQASSSTTRREAPSSSWSSTPQPSRRGTSTLSSSFRSGYSASRRGRSGRSSRRR
ncbi:serine/arginine repetitive matrix protein 2-like [Palaemon carinicauda]|uniref:serine/arginine repetitive matrix protein 2-like n=1 Tax=Palaemon carinicauda TaxID=392227 RepID=UPI0035B6A16E